MNAFKEESMQIENTETASNSPSHHQAQLSPFEEKISLQRKPKKRERSSSSNGGITEITRKIALQMASSNSSLINVQNTNANTTSQQQSNDLAQLPIATNGQVVKKEKQRPETWNKIEQQIFFNALRQNGKNFEAITQYFNTRQKRYKIDAGQRSKEQIRHFFYRTWHKVSKYISLPKVDESIHDIQVNCVIAFNALMNKSHRWNKKSALKLVELINHGWTTVRKKGKITRLRMPICKPSKNSVTTTSESNVALPQTISLYLHPKHEISFCRVQKLAQNPYLMVEVQNTQSIGQLISMLESKWKDRKMEFLEKIFADSSDETFSLQDEQIVLYPDDSHDFSNLIIESNISAHAIEESNECSHQPSTQNLVPSINTTNAATTSFINQATTSSSTNGADVPTTCMKIKIKSFDSHTVKEKKGTQPKPSQNAPIAPVAANLPTEDDEALLMSTEDEIEREEPLSNHANEKSALLTTAPSATLTPSGKNTQSKYSQNRHTQAKKQPPTFAFKSALNVDQLKNGFRSNSSSDITFVQLYLALNRPLSIKLRYEWLPMRSDATPHVANELNVDVIERQKFYLDVLSRVADSFLTEMKISQESMLESRLNSQLAGSESALQKEKAAQQSQSQDDAISSIQAAIQQSNSNESSSGLENNNQDEEANSDHNNKATKRLQDIQSKNRKSRQRKPIVVKSSRPVLPKSAETSSIKASTQNIVLSGPIEAIPRHIVSLADDRMAAQPAKAYFVAPTSTNYVQPCIGNNLYFNMGNMAGGFQMQMSENNLVEFGNGNFQTSKSAVSAEKAANIVSSFQHSNIIPQIMANLIGDSNRHSMEYEDGIGASLNMDMSDRGAQNNNDASLMDASIHDSLFGLNENSNMSTLSLTNLLNSLQTKTIMQSSFLANTQQQAVQAHGSIVQQSQQHQNYQHQPHPLVQTNNFYFNNSVQSNYNSTIVNNINTTNQASSTYHTAGSNSFKRIDTNEWNEAMSDISLSGFINEIQSPEKRNLLNIINDSSRDSLFFNTQ